MDSEGTPHCRKPAYILINVRDASLDLPTTTPFAHETEVSNPDRRVTSDALSRASSDRYVVHRALGTARRDGRCDASQWLEYTVQTQKNCGLAKICHMICIILPNTWPKEHTSTCKNKSGPNKYMKQMNTSVLSATVLYAHAWVAVCRDSPLFPQYPNAKSSMWEYVKMVSACRSNIPTLPCTNLEWNMRIESPGTTNTGWNLCTWGCESTSHAFFTF